VEKVLQKEKEKHQYKDTLRSIATIEDKQADKDRNYG
jgi:hypothetical protein